MASLVLASTSPYRAKILADAGIRFQTHAPGVDETAFTHTDPGERALAIATAKAESVPGNAIVVAADQVAFDPMSRAIFGKPNGSDDHVRRLLGMRGRPHDLFTGFVVGRPGAFRSGVERTRIHVRDVTEAEVRAYVATGDGSGCAGGYAAEGLGAFLIERVEGDWNNVIGLPLYRVFDVLRELGWRFDAR